jgi:flagellar basal-body rod protein FlgG
MRAMWVAQAGMLAQQGLVDVVAHNLANVNTPGYRRVHAVVSELASERLPPGVDAGTGAALSATLLDPSQGPLVETGMEADLAVLGDGFFVVDAPQGERYVRGGRFRVGPDGYLMTAEGYRLRGVGRVPAEAEKLVVGSDGRVRALLPGGGSADCGRVVLARFRSPSGLVAEGSAYAASAASGPAVLCYPGEGGAGTLLQGFLERSNVDLAGELVQLIVAQRAYELCARVVQVQDDMLAQAASMKR